MSKTKKKLVYEDVVKEKEPPAHRSRREIHRKVDKYCGPVEEWDDDDEEIQQFEPIRRRKK